MISFIVGALFGAACAFGVMLWFGRSKISS